MAEGDASALAQAAFDLLADVPRYRSMSAAACAEVSAKFERGAQTAILESYYDEAAGMGW